MKVIYKTLIFVAIITSLLGKNSYATMEEEDYIKRAKQDIFVLCLAYDGYIKDIEVKEDGKIFLVMKSGKKVLYDDKVKKGFEDKLSNGDLQDMLEEPYPLEMIDKVQEDNIDPGRVRVYNFFDEVYGKGENNIKKNLKSIDSPFGTLKFNGENRGGESLKKALTEVYSYCKNNSRAYNYVAPTNGTFNYRVIQDTGRLSAHSYGIAIDLNRNENDYWKWAKKENASKRIEGYPKEVVKIFEDNGFVWGGKWAHFDILHYEYRPEIILKAKYFGNENGEGRFWYGNLEKSEKTDYYINLIEEAFKKIS